MSQLPRAELAGILFQEITSYLPEIQNGISILENTPTDQERLSEIYRLFHNIKGAASQVTFLALSNSASICEALISGLLESGHAPSARQLVFLGKVNDQIREFCNLEHKSAHAEDYLFSATVSLFRDILESVEEECSVDLPDNIYDLLKLSDISSLNAHTPLVPDDNDLQALRIECLTSLRSIVPLLQELTGCSTYTGIKALPATVLQPMISALSTLAHCSHAAGLSAQEELLSSFLDIIETLHQNPCLTDKNTLELLQEFLSYLDLIFALPPSKGDMIIPKVQEQLSKIVDLWNEKSISPTGFDFDAEMHGEPDTEFQTLESTGYHNDLFQDLSNATTESDADDDFFIFGGAELLEIFQGECSEHLEAISGQLEKIEFSKGTSLAVTAKLRETISQMRISTHTLKGAAAMAGFSKIAASAYSLERFLNWLHEDSLDLLETDVEVINDAVQFLRTLSANINENHDLSAKGNPEAVEEHLYNRITTVSESPDLRGECATNLDTVQPCTADALAIAEKFPDTPGRDIETPIDNSLISNIFLEEIESTDIVTDISLENMPAFCEDLDAGDDPESEELELLMIFQAECEEHLQVINKELNSLVPAVQTECEIIPQIRDSVGRMRRGVHTLKGAAAMTGFDELASCAHTLEDLLDILHDDAHKISPADVSLIAEAIDTIELISQSSNTENHDAGKSISEQIRNHILKEQGKEQHPESIIEQAVEQRIFQKVPEKLQEDDTALPQDTGNIRVQLKDLEELVNIEGELVIARGSMEKLLEKFSQSLDELNTIKDTLRRKSQELEVGFEAQSLYGFGPSSELAMDTSSGSSELAEFDPIELDRYSQLNLIIRSLNEISIDVNAIHTEMTTLESNLQGQVSKQQLAMGLMQEKLMRIRMTPLSSVTRTLFRTVRQTAKRLEKDVQLRVTGEDVLMDRFIWSKTIDPLMHILRNCIDHGIEDVQTRQELNKPSSGMITLDAMQRGRTVVLKISDDGGGIDTERLRAKLLMDRIISADDNLSDQELLPYLFRPSVSTRDDISQISGRGVGLDVVLRNIQELRGRVQIFNSPGQGVTFELNIPITLSVNRAVIIDLGSKPFAVPIQDITEVHKFKREEILGGEQPKVLWNDKPIKLLELAPYLQVASALSPESPDILTLVIDNGDEHVAMQIDRIEEQREVIIKDLGSHLRYVRGISGVTLTGEGTIIPILNLGELAAGSQPTVSAGTQPTTKDHQLEPLKVLVVDDSISVRYSITRLVRSQSWDAYQAVDGLDALEKLETLTPDIIILDIEMPRMNGYEFMSILRNRTISSSTPVIMLTSRASDKHRKKAEELGVNHYMTKPFHEDDFIQLLKTFDVNR